MKENEVAIETGVKTDVTESFMAGLKELFETHYVTMPDESYDLIEGLNDKIDDLEINLTSPSKKPQLSKVWSRLNVKPFMKPPRTYSV